MVGFVVTYQQSALLRADHFRLPHSGTISTRVCHERTRSTRPYVCEAQGKHVDFISFYFRVLDGSIDHSGEGSCNVLL